MMEAFEAIRTLLAVSILFFHFTPPHMGVFYPIINNSYVFVGFFILLSGFVLSYNYADRPQPARRRTRMACNSPPRPRWPAS